MLTVESDVPNRVLTGTTLIVSESEGRDHLDRESRPERTQSSCAEVQSWKEGKKQKEGKDRGRVSLDVRGGLGV